MAYITIISLFLFSFIFLSECDKLKLKREVREVFQLHKYYRNSIRFCQVPFQPPAKFMAKLKWNKHLADKAQITANRCDYAYDSPIDMNFDEFYSVAQNIADSPTIEKAEDDSQPYEKGKYEINCDDVDGAEY
ncbi:unnamed protein product [Heterobilharzia americana]|nr:unnamed protein product [Heterobilharzia americana]